MTRMHLLSNVVGSPKKFKLALLFFLLLLVPLLFALPLHAANGHVLPERPLAQTAAGDDAPGTAEIMDVEGAAGLRLWLPLVGRNSSLTRVAPSSLAQLANPHFDATGGWIELQNEQPFSIICSLATCDTMNVTIPTAPAVAWLGGAVAGPGATITHRLYQSVPLPADYDVQLAFDFLIQSAETTCGADSAGVFVNDVSIDTAFNLCSTQALPAWSERSVSLRAFRGQVVTIDFRMVANDSLNSNLYLDNIELCGTHVGLPPAQRCPVAGWGEVGGGMAQGTGIGAGLRDGREPSVAISADGRPWVAWQGATGSSAEIFVKRWNGAFWEEAGGSASAGGISRNSGVSAEPSLAIAPDDGNPDTLDASAPYVAWHDFTSGDSEIYVRRWSGTAWDEVGTGSASGGGVSNNPTTSFGASLAIAPDGTPWLAWTNVAGDNNEIYVKRFDGVAWVEAGAGSASGGGISNNAGDSEEPVLAIGRDGTVMVAWADDSSGDFEIYAKRWTGSSWQSAGANAASDGGISNNSDASRRPALVVNTASDAMVAWVDRGGGDTEIYARRWNGTAWVEAGAGSASGGGISNNAGDSGGVALGAGRDGRPLAAWTDRSGGAGEEIYVRRWDGVAWQQVGAGSASGGGISQNPTFSSEATVAIAPDGTPYVLWSNAASNGSAIYAKRYVP